MNWGRDILLGLLVTIIITSAFSLSVTENKWTGNVTVNNTICHNFGIINDGNSTISVILKSTGEISDFTLFNTTTLSIPSNSTKYFRACFTPTTTGQFNGSININQSNVIYPILITINSNPEQSQGSGGCSLLPAVSQYNIRLSQTQNNSITVHVKNTCSQPITSISATIQNANPQFAYITGNIPGQLDAGQTLDLTVNIDGSKESEGQHNFYLTISGFAGDNRISTNINFNVYVMSASQTSGPGSPGSPSITIPVDGYVNQTYQISVTGITSSDEVFIDVQPTNFELKSIDTGTDYYKANYVFTKDGQYTILVKVYHAGALYYQTSKTVTIHPPSYTNSSTPQVAKILWLVKGRIEAHQPIKVEVRTEGGDPVDKAWVKITLPDGNFLSADTDKDGIVVFDPKSYGYSDGFPEGTATIDVRKTGFAQDMSSPHSIQIYINRIPAQILLLPNNITVGEQVTVKLINKNTGEIIDYNGQGKLTSKNQTETLTFSNGIATFTPNYNETYTITVNKNNVMTGATTSFKVYEKPIVTTNNSNNNNLYYIIGFVVLIALIGYLATRGRRRKIKPTFRYVGLGKISPMKSVKPSKSVVGEENVVEVIGENK